MSFDNYLIYQLMNKRIIVFSGQITTRPHVDRADRFCFSLYVLGHLSSSIYRFMFSKSGQCHTWLVNESNKRNKNE